MMKRLLINLCFLFAIFPSCIAQQRTPTMGWSSWNAYRVNISDSLINDMDMLEVGRGMSEEEDRTHFAVWCMMSSPLLIGCDLTKIKPATLCLLTDKQLVAINQDPGRTVGLLTYSADSQQTVVVELKKGQNTLSLHNDHERMPDVDYMFLE